MQVIGIVAEYNPFHTGHAYQIAEARKALTDETAVIAVMSGNWVQRGECAIFDKWTRARAALEGGVDLVLELPTVWAVSSAENFAREAVLILEATGVVTHLSFGSECGDIDRLQRLAACLDSPACQAGLRRFLDAGLPFAACRQAAVRELLRPELADLLSQPNNNLGIEYIRALNVMKSGIRPMTVRRRGAGHDGGDHPEYPSASFLREKLRAGELPGENPASLQNCERAILSKFRVMSTADWALLPDSGATEGLPQRLERAGRQCASLEEFYRLAKTKRYPQARLRRLALWAFLGLSAADVPDAPPCLRVLGFNETGRDLLRRMKGTASLPILIKPAHARALGGEAARLMELEARCTDLFDLCLDPIPMAGREWTTGPVRLDLPRP